MSFYQQQKIYWLFFFHTKRAKEMAKIELFRMETFFIFSFKMMCLFFSK